VGDRIFWPIGGLRSSLQHGLRVGGHLALTECYLDDLSELYGGFALHKYRPGIIIIGLQ